MNSFQQVLTFFPPVNEDIKDIFQETNLTYKKFGSNDPFIEPLPNMSHEQLYNLIYHLHQFRISINNLYIQMDIKIEALKNFKDRYASFNLLNPILVSLIINTINEYDNNIKIYKSMVTDHLLDKMSILDKAPPTTKKDSFDLTNLMKGVSLFGNKCTKCGKEKKISKKKKISKR
jgi:hypothetical protein